MRRSIGIIIATQLIAFAAGSAFGEMTLQGEVGSDLEMRSFSNRLTLRLRDYEVDRRLSRQFLALRLRTPVVNPNFADLLVSGVVAGTYTHVTNIDEGVKSSDGSYLNPALDDVTVSLGLFPLRPYPLRYTYGKVTARTLRYEASRRSETDVTSPGLAAVRRYDTTRQAHTVGWQATFPKGISFAAEGRRERNEVLRQYDFQEDRDIWILFLSQPPNPSPTHVVDVTNDLDDRVLLYVDFTFIDTLEVGEVLSLDVTKGTHDIDVIPTRFNPFSTRVDVQASMQWRIIFTPPRGSTDIDQTGDGLEASLHIGENGRFSNEARLIYNESEDGVQNTTSSLNTIENEARYSPTDRTTVRVLTTYNNVGSDVIDVSSQDINTLQNQTDLRWVSPRGSSASVAHSYNDISTVTLDDKLKSQTHVIRTDGKLPTGWKDHLSNTRFTVTRTRDSKGYKNNQYAAFVANEVTLRTGRVKLTPYHELGYSANSLTNAGITSSSSERRSRLSIGGERPGIPWIGGDLSFKTEWEWRLRDVGVETETRNRYLLELSHRLRISDELSVIALISRDTETFSSELPSDGNPNIPVKVRPDQNRNTYRLDVQAQPLPRLSLSVGGMVVDQNDSRLTRFNVNLGGTVPLINQSIRSFLVRESKQLPGGIEQSFLQLEAQTSYQFRQVVAVFSYSLKNEELTVEDYTYSEIYLKLSRAFDLM